MRKMSISMSELKFINLNKSNGKIYNKIIRFSEGIFFQDRYFLQIAFRLMTLALFAQSSHT